MRCLCSAAPPAPGHRPPRWRWNHPSLATNLTGAGALLAPFLANGLGFLAHSATSGLAVTPDGAQLVVANVL